MLGVGCIIEVEEEDFWGRDVGSWAFRGWIVRYAGLEQYGGPTNQADAT